MDKEKVEGVAFDLTAKVPVRRSAVSQALADLILSVKLMHSQHRLCNSCAAFDIAIASVHAISHCQSLHALPKLVHDHA